MMFPCSPASGDAGAPCRRPAFASVLFALVCLASLQAQDNSKPSDASAPVAAASTSSDETVHLDRLVVTGVSGPRRELETPLAITVLGEDNIAKLAPRSTAELLKAIPGLYVESTGGEAHNNIFPRGVYSSGGDRYTALLEDGLPIIAESELQFTSADNFIRISPWIARVEGLRGGTSGLFTTSAAINTVNFISRQGTDTLQGEEIFTVGDYGLFRNDLWLSGPIGEGTTYAIGGFYRTDHGIRNPGYTSDRGGQFTGNLTHKFTANHAYLTVSFKLLDDRTGFMLPIPLTGTLSNPRSIPGGPDLMKTAASSNDLRITRMPANANGLHDIDLADGIQAKVVYGGTEFGLELGEGFNLVNRNRVTHINKSWNANPFGNATPFQDLANNLATSANVTPGQFAAARGADGNYAFKLTQVSSGQVVAANAAAAATMNGNGLGVIDQIWSTSSVFDNFQDDIRLSKSFSDLGTTVTLGGYFSDLKNKIFWEGVNALIDVSRSYHRLDLTFVNATTGADIGKYTYNGLTNVGSFNFRDTDTEEKDTSVYLNLEQKIGALSLDGGVRYTRLAYDWSQTGTVATDLNTPGGTTPALRNVALYGGPTSAGSVTNVGATSTVGANYQFNRNLAVFARYSYSPRFHTADEALGYNDRATMLAVGNASPTETITQYEIGLKFATRHAGLLLTGYQMEQANLANNDFTIDPVSGLASYTTRLIGQKSRGVEIEGVWTPLTALTFDVRGVVQDPKIQSGTVQNPVTGQPISLSGKVPTRVPKIYGSVGATYTFPATAYGVFAVNATYQYTGRRPAALDNIAMISSYSEVAAGVTCTVRNFIFRVQAQNLFNEKGLTEGDPRTSQSVSATTAYFNARPIFPRSIIASATYKF